MKLMKSFGIKKCIWISVVLILITDFTILSDVQFLRQVFGFFFLTILPGYLILLALKLNKLELTEKFVLSIGLSISFLMFLGLSLNNSLLSLGYETPLSTISLLISFNLASAILTFIVYRMNKNVAFSLPNLNLSTSEKAFLSVPILFPALSIFGTHIMNTIDNNIILMFLLFLIPTYVAFVCFFNQKFPARIYPFVIFLISISLVIIYQLRSSHILGMDLHTEYYYFQTTFDNAYWSVWGHNILDACLSISLLPTVYQSILNIDSEYFYKFFYLILFSLVPLIVFIISKKYIGDFYGFLASIFFISQPRFTISGGRTNIAILFFALAMMVLFNDRIDPLKKRILFIVFMASCMVSHYSTTYIFFFIMLGAFAGMEILSKKYSFKKIVSLTIVILFFAMSFFWYSQVTETSFNAGIYFVDDTLINLNRFFIEESRVGQFETLFGQGLTHPILSRVNWIVTWCTFIFIGIGVLIMLKRYKEMTTISIGNIKHKKPDFLETKFEVGYSVIALTCAGLLIAMVAIPYISIGYDIYRLYGVASIILSVFFVIGGISLSKQTFKRSLIKNLSLKKKALPKKQKERGKGETWKGKENASQVRAYLIILVILIPYFLFNSGVVHTIFGDPTVITLNSEGKSYDTYYVHDQESCGAKWLANNVEQKNIRIYTDRVGDRKLISQAGFYHGINRKALTDESDIEIKGYIYLRYYNVVDGKLLDAQMEGHNITEYGDKFAGKDKIYNNGGAEIWN